MPNDNKNFYIIGKVMGGQRTENLIKLLLDKNQSVYYNSFKNTKSIPSIFYLTISKLTSILNLLMADVVIMPAMCNNYQFDFQLAVLLKKKIVTDFYVSLYDTHVLDKKPLPEGRIVESDSSLAKGFKEIDKRIVNNADINLFLNSSERKYYLQILDIDLDQKKHLILPICTGEKISCELNFFSDRLQNVFNICWWGTYIPLHGLEKIIKAAKILNENHSINFHLHLFGNNSEKAKPYKELIEKLNLTEVVSIYNDKTFSNGKLGSFLEKNCDLVLGNFGDSDKAKHVLGNKIIEGVAMQAPVLTGESIGPREFFSDTDLFYTQNNPEAMASAIFNISQTKKEKIERLVFNAYEIFKLHFSLEAYNKKLDKIINTL